MSGRKSFQRSVTKCGGVVTSSVKLNLSLVPGLGFMNLSGSGKGIICSVGNSNSPTYFPIPGLHEEVEGAGQPVTGENFVVLQFLGKELEQSEFLFRSLSRLPLSV